MHLIPSFGKKVAEGVRDASVNLIKQTKTDVNLINQVDSCLKALESNIEDDDNDFLIKTIDYSPLENELLTKYPEEMLQQNKLISSEKVWFPQLFKFGQLYFLIYHEMLKFEERTLSNLSRKIQVKPNLMSVAPLAGIF